MPRVFPSQIVALIEGAFPDAADNLKLYSKNAPTLSAIVRLVAEIPEELLTISGQDYSDLVSSLESLRYAVNRWLQHGGDADPPRIKRKSSVVVIRDVLKKCPDENPPAGTADLAFIADGDYRANVRNDISTAFSSFHNAEWKPATVLAGAIVEALLLWAIVDSGKARLIPTSQKKALEQWTLGEYIAGAEQLGLIKPETATQAKQAQGFRNLIHPGRAERLGTTCNRGTSLAALAAVDLVVRDLTP